MRWQLDACTCIRNHSNFFPLLVSCSLGGRELLAPDLNSQLDPNPCCWSGCSWLQEQPIACSSLCVVITQCPTPHKQWGHLGILQVYLYSHPVEYQFWSLWLTGHSVFLAQVGAVQSSRGAHLGTTHITCWVEGV